jgi:hypothetical protein
MGVSVAPADIWQQHYRRALITVDLVIILASAFLALELRFDAGSRSMAKGGSAAQDARHTARLARASR